MGIEEQLLFKVMIVLSGISVLAWVALGNILKILTPSTRMIGVANLAFGAGIYYLLESKNSPAEVVMFASDFFLLLSVWIFRSGVTSMLKPVSDGLSSDLASIKQAQRFSLISIPLMFGIILLIYIYLIKEVDFWRIIIFSTVASWEMGYCFWESVRVLMGFPPTKQNKKAWVITGPVGLTSGLMLGMGLFALMGGYRADAAAEVRSTEYIAFLWAMLVLILSLNLAIGGLCAGRMVEQLIKLSERDHLSGVFNRQSIEKKFNIEFERARRSGDPLSCVFLDIDKFKTINDTYGHDVGDIAIKHLAKILTETVRTIDWVGRYGGEEFIVILSHTGQQGAIDAAERIRRALESSSFTAKNRQLKLTASLGVATYVAEETIQTLISRADMAMYQAKQSGRNRVVFGAGYSS